MKQLHTLALAAFAAISLPVCASDFERVQTLSQAEFASLARDFTAVASYRSLAPAEPLGAIGFDIGAAVSATRLDNAAVWEKAGFEHTSVYMPTLRLQKGLPGNVDIGATFTAVPDSDIKLVGAEIKYAFVAGNVGLPALAVRAAATKLSGVDEFDLATRSVELTVSKGFLLVTPYAGVGKVWGTLTPGAGHLVREKPEGSKVFAGFNLNLGIADLAAEVDRIKSNQTVSVKLGFRL
jgi:hypothetical protein